MNIRLFAMDVDGTLTDGKIYMGASGEVMKAFNIKDGQGLVTLRRSGVITAIITARRSEIVTRRAEELGIEEVLQGVGDKASALGELCEKYGLRPEESAFMGDDVGDLPALRFAGAALCPADAVPEVRRISLLVTPSRGGEGAVRDAAEWILERNGE